MHSIILHKVDKISVKTLENIFSTRTGDYPGTVITSLALIQEVVCSNIFCKNKLMNTENINHQKLQKNALLVELLLTFTIPDVFVMDGDVVISIRSFVLMIESNNMTQLMQNFAMLKGLKSQQNQKSII